MHKRFDDLDALELLKDGCGVLTVERCLSETQGHRVCGSGSLSLSQDSLKQFTYLHHTYIVYDFAVTSME